VLIECERHTPADLAHWRKLELQDRLHYRAHRLRVESMARQSVRWISEFVHGGPCYLGVSWGKDSVLLAHLALTAGIDVPLVWVCVTGRENPHCVLVRDAFLRAWPDARYHEIEIEAGRDGQTSKIGFGAAAARFGDRYLSGIRRDESYAREMRFQGHGIASERTCAPLSHWKNADVFAYAAQYELPLHPVYGMTAGGRFDRSHVRTASLGGLRGTQYGRREWELLYYPEELERMGRSSRSV
jgi:phosphoadenosine phosphosulfate reductase